MPTVARMGGAILIWIDSDCQIALKFLVCFTDIHRLVMLIWGDLFKPKLANWLFVVVVSGHVNKSIQQQQHQKFKPQFRLGKASLKISFSDDMIYEQHNMLCCKVYIIDFF